MAAGLSRVGKSGIGFGKIEVVNCNIGVQTVIQFTDFDNRVHKISLITLNEEITSKGKKLNNKCRKYYAASHVEVILPVNKVAMRVLLSIQDIAKAVDLKTGEIIRAANCGIDSLETAMVDAETVEQHLKRLYEDQHVILKTTITNLKSLADILAKKNGDLEFFFKSLANYTSNLYRAHLLQDIQILPKIKFIYIDDKVEVYDSFVHRECPQNKFSANVWTYGCDYYIIVSKEFKSSHPKILKALKSILSAITKESKVKDKVVEISPRSTKTRRLTVSGR